MAMTGAGLSAARIAAKNAVPAPANTTAAAQAYAQALQLADSTAIVTYITANAVVAVASVSGVTTGGGVSGPGTGTIS